MRARGGAWQRRHAVSEKGGGERRDNGARALPFHAGLAVDGLNKLYVVGIGPGGAPDMTAAARAAMDDADVLCGYTVYIDLVRSLYPDKEFFTTPMTQELARCRWAVETARTGKTVAMLCSGDAGVYGMAGPLLELAAEDETLSVEIVPGVTAALAGAAALGAPLMHDFCVISLSDLLTPWETIEARLRAAVLGDFCLCLYNPASRKRPDHLRRACELLLAAGKSPDTVCGWVRNIGREGQSHRILPLSALKEEAVDMFTTVFIGNSATQALGGRMITPRGYGAKQCGC